MIIEIKGDWKSIKKGRPFKLPNFTVLTGPNGCGKTQLLEAMMQKEIVTITKDNGEPLQNIKYIPYNALNPNIFESSTYNEIVAQTEKEWKMLQNQLEELNTEEYGDVESYINFFEGNIQKERDRYLGRWYRKAGKDITKLNEQFVLDNFEIDSDEQLINHIAAVFKIYHLHLEDNDYHTFLNEKKGCNFKVLTQEEFLEKYGPKPWDLINQIMQRSGLPYEINSPEGTTRESSFSLKITDINSNIEINVSDLSTGEKVLLSLALTIYNTKDENIRPDVLLIDEPDAPLHPLFSRILIESVIESIVNTAGVKVIITTHSPSSVAIAPDESIFRMDKLNSRPVEITKQKALLNLTHEVNNLRVSIENRRQIFVESKYDVEYYNKIYCLIDHPFPVQPQFLAPNNTDGSNCDDVKNMTKALRDMGNDLVYGFVDSDGHYQGTDYVFPLGNGNRYAIDNYIFDPIYTALLLLQQHIVNSGDMGIAPCKFTSCSSLSHDDIQKAIYYVAKELQLDTEPDVEYITQKGEKFLVSGSYFHLKGHEVEDKIKEKWPKLKAISKQNGGGDNKLKNYVLQFIIEEYPQYLSQDFVELMNKVV